MRRIGIFSLEADLHAHAIVHELELLNEKVHFFPSDAQIEKGGITWELGREDRSVMRDYRGNDVHVRSLDVVWWRRVNQPQRNRNHFESDESFELTNNEWKSGIFGVVSDSFRGTWVNHPSADSLAGNKIYHLRKAKEVGLTIPRTIVTNDQEAALSFFDECEGSVIAKKILGGPNLSLATLGIAKEQLVAAGPAIKVAPSMYQERIKGTKHVRANCFGNRVESVLIESHDLDWRRNLNCKFSPYDLGADTNGKLTILLEELDLRMGIMDLMITENDIVWLEINPQGQFLFAEGMSGLNLKRVCAEFLAQVGEAATKKCVDVEKGPCVFDYTPER